MSYPEGDMAETQELPQPTAEKKAELQDSTIEYLRRINEVLVDPSKADELAQQLALEKRNLEQLIERDPLTGLLNRTGFDREFNRFLHRFRRSLEGKKGNANSLGSILFIDLDHFRKANEDEARGKHAFGDYALKEVAKIIGDSVRPDDIVCRYGGEEIMVLLTECNIHNAIGVAERMRKGVHNKTPDILGGYLQTVSIGVAQMSENVTLENIDSLAFLGDDGLVEWVRRAADEAMYHAKEKGRNRTAVKTTKGDLGVLEQNQNGSGTTIKWQNPPSK